ncbi:MAG: hypothetical protein FD123_2509 [Bacteroidetes bacterium]|nr:MAG: hypothetical protein FD123_2509 [Bacteroidota bacterium]
MIPGTCCIFLPWQIALSLHDFCSNDAAGVLHMKKAIIDKTAFHFLKKIRDNNNRDWFNAHKAEYTAAYESMIVFADALLEKMQAHDRIETPSGKKSLFRIYRDVRFSKDKTPYQTCWHGHFSRATKKLRGGYYYHIQPGNTYVGGGFWGPNAEDLKRIRQDIDYNHTDWRKMLANKKIKNTFGALAGEKLKTAPQGYLQDHPAIDLLRHKQFVLTHRFTDKEVLSADFLKNLNETMKNFRPFFDYMSEVLTTDANGISLVD